VGVDALRRRSITVGALFAIATALFVIGVSSESDHHSSEARPEPSEAEARGSAGRHGSGAGSGGGEEFRPLGLQLESTPLLVAVAIVSFLIAAMVIWRPTRGWLWAVVVVGVTFAALEVAEVAHQSEKGETALIVVALAACMAHLVAALLAVSTLQKRRSTAMAA